MLYRDLNLKHLREVCDIDFAHFTYKPNQCSCCYGPLDLPARYWRNGKKPPEYVPGTEVYNNEGKLIGGKYTDYEYILFKNAHNGSGYVKSTDEIKPYQCVSWSMSQDKLKKVVEELKRQLGADYKVVMPESEHYCIEIIHKSHKNYSETI